MKKNALSGILVVMNLALLTIAATPTKKVIPASEIDIVDAKGVIRARLGADLPDAVVDGKPVKRGGHPAGLMLYAHTAQERGGYVTFPDDYIGFKMASRQPPRPRG